MLPPNDVTRQIVDAAYRIHRHLGPGLLETVYESSIAWELKDRGLHVSQQQGIPLLYQNIPMGIAFYADLIVDDQIIVELKSVDAISPVHKRQLLTYLRLANKRLGLLINFNVFLIWDGITRIANGLPE